MTASINIMTSLVRKNTYLLPFPLVEEKENRSSSSLLSSNSSLKCAGGLSNGLSMLAAYAFALISAMIRADSASVSKTMGDGGRGDSEEGRLNGGVSSRLHIGDAKRLEEVLPLSVEVGFADDEEDSTSTSTSMYMSSKPLFDPSAESNGVF